MSERNFSVSAERNALVLRPDNWNDYGYTTLYDAFYRDAGGNLVELGGIKIGCLNYDETQRPIAPGRYLNLNNQYFSVGQDQNYYRNITNLGKNVADEIFSTLQDMAWDDAAFARAQPEEVTQTSLYRQVNAKMITGQFRRIARGGELRQSFQLEYTLPQFDRDGDHPKLTFSVEADSTPPTNLHVLIGRNGVGKTSLLRNMVTALVQPEDDQLRNGSFVSPANPSTSIVNLVMIAFSAFDPFHEFEKNNDQTSAVQFSHVGLTSEVEETVLPGPADAKKFSLDRQFISGLESIVATRRGKRWTSLIKILENDPIFESYQLARLIDRYSDSREMMDASGEALQVFNSMSSGHKIVLLTITRLVEKVTERTLVLIDEPESHLHPPLLSNLLRAISMLLKSQNGVAFIATHSPVVLQEVPRACVWALRRHGDVVDAARPRLETFGENVGILTHDVFGLEVQGSGFHQIVRDVAIDSTDFASILQKFGDQLGSEARGIARIMAPENDPRKNF